MRGTRLDGLDALRGVAAAAVMLYHYSSEYSYLYGGHPPPGLRFAAPYGNLGVDFFFLISGFAIGLTLERAPGAGAFLGARAARLFPGFWTAMAVTLAAGALLGGEPVEVRVLVANLTMAPALFGVAAVDAVYWSLQYEWAFYLLAAGTLLSKRGWPPEAWCGIWLAGAAIARMVGPGEVPELLDRLTAIPFAHLFAIGVMLHRVHAGRATRWTWVVFCCSWALTLGGPAQAVLNPLPPLVYAGLVAGFALAIGLAARMGGWGRLAPVAGFLGRVSYPLYLVHRAAGMDLIARLEAASVSPDAAAAVAIAGSVLVAWAIADGVEPRARAWLHGRLGGAKGLALAA